MAKPWQRRLQIVAAALARPISAPTRAAAEEEAVLERAQAIHAKAISIDTHIDINPRNFTHEKSYADRLDSQVDLVKMQEGGLDAVFLVAYVGQVKFLSLSLSLSLSLCHCVSVCDRCRTSPPRALPAHMKTS